MAETEAKLENSDGEGRQNDTNPIFSLFSRFQLFNFPPQKQDLAAKPEDVVVAERSIIPVCKSEKEEKKKAEVVKLPNAPPEFPSLKLEVEECEQNPIVLWQVYAIGGFFVLKWVLARLKERSTRRRTSDDDPPQADD